jgi:hypothetical protein
MRIFIVGDKSLQECSFLESHNTIVEKCRGSLCLHGKPPKNEVQEFLNARDPATSPGRADYIGGRVKIKCPCDGLKKGLSGHYILRYSLY